NKTTILDNFDNVNLLQIFMMLRRNNNLSLSNNKVKALLLAPASPPGLGKGMIVAFPNDQLP
ncbi:hypothetical protein A2U01_0093861, partial [Trifolium medium]|nr:hypothetical protein [Trifolium medium]